MSLVNKTTGQILPVIEVIQQVREIIWNWKHAGETIAFVPTMGHLHEGHLALLKQANALGTKTVVSIFVNPMQFGKNDDFDEYPRTLDDDLGKLYEYNVDFVFAPSVDEVYPGGGECASFIDIPGFSSMLDGEHRPGFFPGVATVVNKLFNIIQPNIAVFGEKDYQQLMVVRQMVNDLSMPVEIRSVTTVREADGLAMSSRNGYLNNEQRSIAVGLYGCLERVVEAVRQGEDPNFEVVHATHDLTEQGFIVDYVVVRRQQDLSVPQPGDKALIALAAARLGSVRLIDNIPFELSE